MSNSEYSMSLFLVCAANELRAERDAGKRDHSLVSLLRMEFLSTAFPVH
jgi:hypothetical protein